MANNNNSLIQNSPTSSLFLMINPLPSTDDEINDKILDTVEKLRLQQQQQLINSNNNGVGGSSSGSGNNGGQNVSVINFPNCLPNNNGTGGSNSSESSSTSNNDKQTQQQQQKVLQCVISRNHVAVLLDDNRVCRFPFTVIPDRINASINNLNSESSSTSSSSGGGGGGSSSSNKRHYYSDTGRSSSSGSINPVAVAAAAAAAAASGSGGSGGGGSGGSGSAGQSGSQSPRTIPTRRRLVRTRTVTRTGGSVIINHHRGLYNLHVPEELINQAQNVLQGKSRNVIMRELQRTNLDVNSAVNNLLSRDDEDFDDADDATDHIIGSEDLISLLDSGFHNDHSVIIDPDFHEEVFPYHVRISRTSSSNYNNGSSSSTTGGGSSGSGGGGSSSNNAQNSSSSGGGGGSSSNLAITRTSSLRNRDELFASLDREFNSNSRIINPKWFSMGDGVKGLDASFSKSSSTNSKKSKSDQLQLPPISFSDQQEYWLGPNDRRLIQIASLHSELIAINSMGQLCQWRWQDSEPYKNQTQDGQVYYHPRVPSLALLTEKIHLLSASIIRATVVTEQNKIATWMDESIAPITWKMEHSANNQIFLDSIQSTCTGPMKIIGLFVSSLMSCVQLSNNSIYWWGTPPFVHRKRMIEKGQNEKNNKSSKSGSKSLTGGGGSGSNSNYNPQSSSSSTQKDNEIVQGTYVCMRNSPIYQVGSIGFTTVGGIPKVGQLITAAWKITDSYSFRVLTVQEIQSRLSSSSSTSSTGTTSTNTTSVASKDTNATATASTSSVQSNLSEKSKNSERSEMPPPPSPASSTSSESSTTAISAPPPTKRSRGRNLSSNQQQQQMASNLSTTDDNKNSSNSSSSSSTSEKIETWNLSDVVFLEDVKNMPIGRVIKVDGNFVAVKFNTTNTVATSSSSTSSMEASSSSLKSYSITSLLINDNTTTNTANTTNNSNLIESYIQDCRLLRKDDLIPVRCTSSFPPGTSSTSTSTSASQMIIGNKSYDNFQRTPKRIPIAEHLQILAMTLTNLGLHVIAKMGGYRLSYLKINLVTGRIEHDNKLSIEYSTFFGNDSNPKSPNNQSLIRLFSAGENEQTTIVLCRDGNGTLYPLAKDCTNTVIREPIQLNLGPITSIGLGVYSLANINGTTTSSSSSSSSSSAKTHAAIMAFVLDRQYLIPAILNNNLDLVRDCLDLLQQYPQQYFSMISEICDGNHNILHIAVTACFPSSNNKSSSNTNTGSGTTGSGSSGSDFVQFNKCLSEFEELDIEHFTIKHPVRLQRKPQLQPVVDSNENSMDDSTTTNNAQSASTSSSYHSDLIEPPLDPMEQNPIAHSILWTLLDSPALSRHLFDLLSARDYQGLTPFMLAISGRAYSAAQQIFVVIQRVARMISINTSSSGSSNDNDSTTTSNSASGATTGTGSTTTINSQDIYQRAFLQMLYPRGSSPDHSPLYMLCSNDTCSFTWTGEEHINQDIFECKTCGLVGSLCCCTECARVCHRGHDCKLKKTSPTAYCDCWEKCKCKALVAGCQPARYSLLKRLLVSTDLSQRVNSRGEHILLFLVQTVFRQILEQKQYRPTRIRPFISSVGGSSGRSGGSGGNSSSNQHSGSSSSKHDLLLDDSPEHDLEPPKFARRALEKMLSDWPTVKSMILTGYRSSEKTIQQRRRQYLWNLNGTANNYSYEEENSYLSCQNGSALLDKFVLSLLKLVQNESIERITNTIVLACKNPQTQQEAKIVAHRFVRSIIRVSMVILFETSPTHYSLTYLPFAKNNNNPSGGSSGNNSNNNSSTPPTYLDRYLSATSGITSSTTTTGGSGGGGGSSGSSSSSSSASFLKKSNNIITMMRRIRKVFVAFLPIACEELCEASESLIAPVKLGLCLPLNPFMMIPTSGSGGSSGSGGAGGSSSCGSSSHHHDYNSTSSSLTDELFSVDTTVFAHQNDFLDSTLSLQEIMMDDPIQDQSSMIWNAYESAVSRSSQQQDVPTNNENNETSSSSTRREEQRNQQQQQNNDDNDIEMIEIPDQEQQQQQRTPPPQSMVYDLSQQSTTSAAAASAAASNDTSSAASMQLSPPEIIIVRPPPNDNDQQQHQQQDNLMDGGPSSAGRNESNNSNDIVMEMLVANSSEPDDYSNVGGRDTESDSESNPDDASYLSNADNASAQRSVVTGATAGSDIGVASLPYDDDSINSNADDVDDNDEDEDEQDVEDSDESSESSDEMDTPETEPEFESISNFIHPRLDRRLNDSSGGGGNSNSNANSSSGGGASSSLQSGGGSNGSIRNNLFQQVQWALRSGSYLSNYASANSSANLDPLLFRRNAVGGGSGSNSLITIENVVQINNSMVGLARSFSILVRHIADLMVLVRDLQQQQQQQSDFSMKTANQHQLMVCTSSDFHRLTITPLEAKHLQQTMEQCLNSTWLWLINCMDSTETQLRFGCALTNRRLAPNNSVNSSQTGIGGSTGSGSGGSGGSGSNNPSTSSTDSAQNLINSLVNSSSNGRLPRLRTFQTQDEMAMLPTFNRNTTIRRNIHHATGQLVIRQGGGNNSGSGSGGGGGGSGSNSGQSGLNSVTSFNEANNAAHRDFLNYAMSLMRSHSNEHYDSLPMLDVGSYKHVAYIFDAFVYFIRRGILEEQDSRLQDYFGGVSDQSDQSSGRNHPFFRRSNSTLYLGCPRPDPFSASYKEALPLADKPVLLQPNARREQLFGIPRPTNAAEAEKMLETLPLQMSLAKRQNWNKISLQQQQPSGTIPLQQTSPTPTRSQSVITESPSSSRNQSSSIIQPNKLSVIVMAGSMKHQQQQQSPGGTGGSETNNNSDVQIVQQTTTPTKSSTTNTGLVVAGSSSKTDMTIMEQQQKLYFFGNIQQQDILLGRWRLTLELFGRLFVDDVALEPNSIIHELSGFPIKESKFRRQMELLRISCSSSCATQRDLNFYKLDRDRNQLLMQTFKELNAVFSPISRRLSSPIAITSQPLTIIRVKVTFKDEPGEGTGVARSFYTAFSEAVLNMDALPPELLTDCGAPQRFQSSNNNSNTSGGSGSGSGSSYRGSSSSGTSSSGIGSGTSGGGGSSSGSGGSSQSQSQQDAPTTNYSNYFIRFRNAYQSSSSSSSSQSHHHHRRAHYNASGTGGGSGSGNGSGSNNGSIYIPINSNDNNPSFQSSTSSSSAAGSSSNNNNNNTSSTASSSGSTIISSIPFRTRNGRNIRTVTLPGGGVAYVATPTTASSSSSTTAAASTIALSSPSTSTTSSSASTSSRRLQLIERIRNMHHLASSGSTTTTTTTASSNDTTTTTTTSTTSGTETTSTTSTTSSTSTIGVSSSLARRLHSLRYDSPMFGPLFRIQNITSISNDNSRLAVGLRIYNRVNEIYPRYASKITGMLMDLNQEILSSILTNNSEFRLFVDYAMDLIFTYESSYNNLTSSSSSSNTTNQTSSSSTGTNNTLVVNVPFDGTNNSGTTSNNDSAAGTTSGSSSSGSGSQQQQQNRSVSPTNQILALLVTNNSNNTNDINVSYVGGGQDDRKSNASGSGTGGSKDKGRLSPGSTSTSSSAFFDMLEFQEDLNNNKDNAALFYQPGQPGFYSPRPGRSSDNRLLAFRNVGRIIGVCFVQNELCPIKFNRHVIKMILGQQVSWHDLAFFDPDLYESLRQLILSTETNSNNNKKEGFFSECDFRFAIDLPPQEGGQEIELIPNGRNIRVTAQNVYDYVRRYAQCRMVESHEKAVMAIRAGIFDVIPSNSFDGLTPEDFRLLLNGVNEINVQQLQTYVTFYDESGDPDPMNTFQKWFWWVVDRMTNEEKHDLIYFWTGSPALPASEEGFQPKPSVTIRPRDDFYYVTANTCISRLYIPLYSTRNILRQKLLMSIKSKSFGFI